MIDLENCVTINLGTKGMGKLKAKTKAHFNVTKGGNVLRFTEHFKEEFKKVPTHQQMLEFVNIRLDTDNLLFIDPTIMAISKKPNEVKWNQKVQGFIATVLDLYENGKVESARKLFNFSKESNEIFLGYSVGKPGGTGNSEESLNRVFTFVHTQNLLKTGVIKNVEDLKLFVPDFGPDALSDLVASLLKKELIEFTIEQCDKYKIPRTVELKKPSWNHDEQKWEEITATLPEDDIGKPIVLIPKGIVTAQYKYDPVSYLADVLSSRQQYHKDNDTELHGKRSHKNGVVNKDLIKVEEIEKAGLTENEYLIKMTIEDIELIKKYRKRVENKQKGTNNGKMTDAELQEFITKSYQQ